MKKLSETLTKLGITFSFPINIMEANGKVTYHEDSSGYWERWEYDAKGRPTYHEDSNGYWCKYEYDADGNETYFEDSEGVKKGTPKTAIIDCQHYTPESWKEICDIQEPAAVWLEGKQMTDLMKDKERISWLLTTQSFMAMHQLGTCEDIDEAMEVNQ